MSNPEKSRRMYQKVVATLDDLARESPAPNFERVLLTAHTLFLGGYQPPEDDRPSYEFGASLLDDMLKYYALRRKRTKKEISGGEREITTEDEAFESLVLAESISRNLIIPFFTTQNPFSHSIFKDIYHLGLSYLHSITGAVADQYIPMDEARTSKLEAVNLAKGSARLLDQYYLTEEVLLNQELKNIQGFLEISLKELIQDTCVLLSLCPQPKNIFIMGIG